jgi:hypothetical protein
MYTLSLATVAMGLYIIHRIMGYMLAFWNMFFLGLNTENGGDETPHIPLLVTR